MLVGTVKTGGIGHPTYDNVIQYEYRESGWLSYVLIPMNLTEEEKLVFSIQFGFLKFQTIDEFKEDCSNLDPNWLETRIKSTFIEISKPNPRVYSLVLIGK